MAIVPIVNGGNAITCRRPRRALGETQVISSAYTIHLRSSTVGYYRPGPNNLTILSNRIRCADTQGNLQNAPWGGSYVEGSSYAGYLPVADDVGTTANLVGYLQVRSIDSDSDGYDDMESEAIVLLNGCFATYSDGMVAEGESPLSGSGQISLYGSGEIHNILPISGAGAIEIYGSGAFLNLGAIAGSGVIELYGSGALANVWPLTSGGGAIEISGSGAVKNINPVAGAGAMNVYGSGTIGVASSGPSTLFYDDFESYTDLDYLGDQTDWNQTTGFLIRVEDEGGDMRAACSTFLQTGAVYVSSHANIGDCVVSVELTASTYTTLLARADGVDGGSADDRFDNCYCARFRQDRAYLYRVVSGTSTLLASQTGLSTSAPLTASLKVTDGAGQVDLELTLDDGTNTETISGADTTSAHSSGYCGFGASQIQPHYITAFGIETWD